MNRRLQSEGECRPDKWLERSVLPEQLNLPQPLADQQDSADVVERAGADRETTEAGGLRHTQIFAQRFVEPERHHLFARTHHLLRRYGPQAERPYHDSIDQRVAGMRVPRLAENVFELFRAEGVFAFAGGFESAPAEDLICGAIEQPDERKKDAIEDDQR